MSSNSYMGRAISILVFCAYFLGMLSGSPAAAMGTIKKITVTHSHAVEESHEHTHMHDGEEVSDHHHEESKETSKQATEKGPEKEHQHSHEILVMGNALFFSIPRSTDFSLVALEPAYPMAGNVDAPHYLFLNSIFRPPIA